MTAYYDLLDTLKALLEEDENVTTVTQGDIYDIDLAKQTLFPLSHIQINSVASSSNLLTFNVSIFCMDIVDKSKEETTDIFVGNDNETDVLNTQLAVLMRLLQMIRRGDEFDTTPLLGEDTTEPFTERFENYLAGWVSTFDIQLPNTMTIC